MSVGSLTEPKSDVDKPGYGMKEAANWGGG